MDAAPRLAYVVSHTHWDREWYLPFSSFRVMLLRTVEGVVEALERDPDYRHFCLDGQSVILEDVLEARPDLEERLRRLANAGALALGPWYVLPDEFLIPPEATVRNLVIGRRAAARIGPVQPIGYAPDAFGHIAQMPQILTLAGIDAFVYTRGNQGEIDETGLEWTWRAPDGSEVLAIHQEAGYCNACGLGYEEMWHAHTQRAVDPERAVAQLRTLFDRMAKRSNGDVWLLMNGCDHFPVQRDFAAVLGRLREAFPSTKFLHASLAEYVAAVRRSGIPVPRFEGELRGGRLHHVLSGVWSARMPLKQQNERAHAWLADVAEPLRAYARFRHGLAYPHGLFEATWKELLKNQPHDSICGCSIDAVHEEMKPRFDRVLQTCDQVVKDSLLALAPTFGTQPAGDRDTVLAVFNPLPERRRALIERIVVLQDLDYDLDALRLVDDEGRIVPCEVVFRERARRFWGVDWRMTLEERDQGRRLADYAIAFGDRFLRPTREGDLVDTFLKLRAWVDLPALGHVRLRLEERPGTQAPSVPDAAAVTVRDDTLENAQVSVRVHPDGTFDLLDKRSGQRFPNLNRLEDVEDVGDEYDHAPATDVQTVEARGISGEVSVLDEGRLRGTLEARFELPLPSCVSGDRQSRTDERVACPVCVRISLEAGSPLVDVDVLFENLVEDHRLSARFPTGIATDRVVSDAHFLLADRAIDPPDDTDWVQPAPDTLPQQGFSFVRAGPRGIAVLNQGLPEIAALRAPDRTVDLRLTLLRAVGWLSRDDFPTRRFQNAGPTVPTPEAQCPGLHLFRYAVLALVEETAPADVRAWSRRWKTPLPCVQGVLEGSTPGGEGLLALTSGRSDLTAVKRHEERDTLVVRLYNLTGERVDETLRLGFAARAAWRTDLHEIRGHALTLADPRTLTLTLARHEIATLEIEPA